VAVIVVHRLEAVQVQQHQRKRLARARRARPRLVQARAEVAHVLEPGERIRDGQLVEPPVDGQQGVFGVAQQRPEGGEPGGGTQQQVEVEAAVLHQIGPQRDLGGRQVAQQHPPRHGEGAEEQSLQHPEPGT
jgi:hypothetical protein